MIHLAEVRFYFTKALEDNDGIQTFALVSLYSPPNAHILRETHGTLAVCRYRDREVLMAIDIKSILSVVAMAPFPFIIDGHGDQFFLIEKVGLDVVDADPVEDNE